MKFRTLLFGLLAAFTLSAPAMAQMVNAQTGTTYTIANTDCDPQAKKLLTFNNAAGIAVTLPQAGGAAGFQGGCVINAVNVGLGAVTITPTTSTINGGSAITLAPYTGATIYNDSTPATVGNYWTNTGAGVAGGPPTSFRNLVHNGAMQVQQRGVAERTCAANAGITTAAYVADRWGCQVNVASGAGFAVAVATGGPTTQIPAHMQVYRKTGALLQPVCAIQEISSADTATMAGATVSLSFWMKGLANLLTDSPLVSAYILYGTGTDQGFGTPTASPAITPAWTGINSSLTKQVTLTSAFQRFSYTAALPSTATESAVAFCWTPTSASNAGTTDGFDFSGVQMESSPLPTPYETHPFTVDLGIALQHYFQTADTASTTSYPSACTVTTANTTLRCTMFLPAAMRVAPTTAVGTATSYGIILTAGTAGTCTTLAVTASSNTTTQVGLTCTTGGTIALGSTTPIIGANTGGLITISADF